MRARLAAFDPPGPAVEEAMDNVRRRLAPALLKRPGFLAGYWLRRADGQVLSISLWETEGDIQSAERDLPSVPLEPGQEASKIPSPDHVDSYEVLGHVDSSGGTWASEER
jgi:hypothetical protein